MSRKTFKRRFLLILLGFVLLLSGYLFLHSSVFNLRSIEVAGNDKVTREEIIALSGLAPGINLFEFNEVVTAKSIEVHPMIKQAEIERKPTNKVVIRVTERQVWAVIPYDDLFLCIDDSGVCFDKLNHGPIGHYLIITMDEMPERVNLGQVVNSPATDMIRQIWAAMAENEQQMISDINYQNEEGTIKIYTVKGTEVRFGDLERLEEKIATFARVLQIENELEQRGTDVLEYVDIRFKGEPVVKTRN